MAASFISTLPRSLRTAWSLMTRGVSEGLSANRIQSVLSDVGLGVRRQTLLDGIRLVKEGFAKDKTLRLLAPNVHIPLKMIPNALTAIRRRFAYTLQVEGVFQGKVTRRMVTLSTDSMLSRGAAESRIWGMMETDAFGYGEKTTVMSVGMVGIRKAGIMGMM